MKFLKKIGKKGLVVLSILIISGVAIAGTFGWFVNLSGEINSSVLLQYNDGSGWQDAEELSIVYDLSVLNGAGDFTTIEFSLHHSEFSSVPRTFYYDFLLTNSTGEMPIDGSEGITIYIENETFTEVTNTTLDPNEIASYIMYIELSPMLKADTFTMSMTIDDNEPL